MKSIDRLVAEHDLIERGLDVLEKFVSRIESGQPIPERFSQWAPEFFSQFADKCHHAKEEDLFFPLLKQRGIPGEGGPIGVMLHEHEVGRDCVRRMRAASMAAYHGKKSISITNKDRRRDAFMNYRMGRMSRLRYLFYQLVYDPIRFGQYPLVARFCSLVLFKGAELTRDFGKGRPGVRSILDPGFSAEHIIEADALASKLATLRDPEHPLELLYFGRLVYYKGVDRCVRALGLLAERGVVNVRLNIMGTGVKMEPLRELASELGVGDRVVFLEPAPYGPEFFGKLQPCHLMLAAPLSEDTPRSTWDAIASGLPVLAFDTLFYRSMLDTGVVETVEWPSVDALAARIEHYCAQRDELAALASLAPEVARENTQELWLDKRVRWTRELFEPGAPVSPGRSELPTRVADQDGQRDVDRGEDRAGSDAGDQTDPSDERARRTPANA